MSGGTKPCPKHMFSFGPPRIYFSKILHCIIQLGNLSIWCSFADTVKLIFFNNIFILIQWILFLMVNKSTLVEVMAWCRQATSHYLSQWHVNSDLSPYGTTRPQWVNTLRGRQRPLCHALSSTCTMATDDLVQKKLMAWLFVSPDHQQPSFMTKLW